MPDPIYTLVFNCTIDDTHGLAATTTSAFWTQPRWRAKWTDHSIEAATTAIAARLPKELLTAPEVRRHQKVVHGATGQIVGYARWTLSDGLRHQWTDAMTPPVSPERREISEVLESKVQLDARNDSSKCETIVEALRNRGALEGRHIRKCFGLCS